MPGNVGFLKPKDDDDDDIPNFKIDRSDVQQASQTTFVYNRNPNLPLDNQRQKLPVFKSKNPFLYLVETHQVVVVVGETGCGKSTQLPQYLLEAGFAKDDGKMIGVTEPRRVAATTLASRVAEEQNCMLGTTVGYSIRFDENFSREATKIKYVTEGILIRELMGDPLLSSYSVIMLDEVHERTCQIDIIMGLLKKVLKRRRDLKLIISSATVDAEYIRDFFNRGVKRKSGPPATILSIEGRHYNVDVHYLTNPCPDYVKGCAEVAIKIHEKETAGDILIFLTGMDEVDSCTDILEKYSERSGESKHGFKMLVLPMYGALSPGRQLKVFRPAPRGFRKIVVATNIAETSVTIDGIIHVIDSCFVKQAWFNTETFTDSLIISEVSQASGEQRAGRAGRTAPGKCYRMCREEEFLKLPLNTPPELQRTSLALAVLQLKALGIDNIVRFEFPSAPPARNLICAMELLFALGAIDDNGDLTKPLGEQMAELPVAPTISKMLLSSGEMGCTKEIATIVAMLQVENIFSPGKSDNVKILKRQFEVEEGDFLTLLNVFYAFEKQGMEKKWCAANALRYKALKRAYELREQLFKVLRRFNIPMTSTTGEMCL
eukprot:TRINITY_DN6624_c0_g1_i2.p1 TRINITY_DN6624_c0_g1~~TRINITY_DN6624_c0_g1_i2.p1  ORF type:complete len:603 (-),score=122.07 TRINITY_DN6624_c0_g1_i2:78-1886(-)